MDSAEVYLEEPMDAQTATAVLQAANQVYMEKQQELQGLRSAYDEAQGDPETRAAPIRDEIETIQAEMGWLEDTFDYWTEDMERGYHRFT